MILHYTVKQSWTLYERQPDDDEPEITDEEERVNDEVLEHPTRDDLHEQRERGQKCEGVVHAHGQTGRPLEPHGFDGTRPRPKGW